MTVADPRALTRLAARSTLSRTAGEGGPGPDRWVGEGTAVFRDSCFAGG
jgi:hypothetical protein